MGVIEDDFLGALRAGKQDEARFHLVQLLDELTVEPGNRAHVDALFAKYSDRFAPPTEHDVFPAPEQGAGLDELQDYLADERLRSADSFSRARYERMRDVALRIAAELGHDPKAQARQGPGHRPEKRFAIGRWGLAIMVLTSLVLLVIWLLSR